jgi:hypothetical protein
LDPEAVVTDHVPCVVDTDVCEQFGAVSLAPQSRVAPFAVDVNLDPDDDVAARVEPAGAKGSKETVVFMAAISVRDGAVGPMAKYPLTTPGPVFAMVVAGDTTDLAAPVPLAVV